MDDHRRNRLKSQLIVGLGVLGFGSMAWGLWQYAQYEPKAQAAIPTTQPTGQVFPTLPAETAPPPLVVGDLAVAPTTLVMGSVNIGEGSYSGSFTVTARERPILVKKISISFAQQSGIQIDPSRCVDRTLAPDESCTVDVVFDPLNPIRVDKQIVIQADSDNSDGSRRALDRHVTLSGEAVRPPPPVVEAAPVLVAPVPVEETVVVNPALAAYLANRNSLGGLDTSEPLVGPQKPEDEDWADAGFRRSMSTYPTDLSRMVTMDKPIPAVLQLGLDTRFSNRAIAQVERDIYGGEGRLVVIPRGSKVIGQVSSSSSTGEEKVQIQWTRIQRPDGAVFAIEAYGGDAMGRPGTPAYIDNRYMERFGMSLLTTVLNVGVTIGLDGKQTVQNTSGAYAGVGNGFAGGAAYGGNAIVQQDARSVATQQANKYLESVTQQLAAEGQEIAPIRTVPAGTRITIFPSQDLFLKPINPTREMRERIIAQQERELQQRQGYSRTFGQQQDATTNRLATVAPNSPSGLADEAYDPVTGQPIVKKPTVVPAAKPIVDANGFPILPGNLGAQPAISARPDQNRPAGALSPTPTVNSPLLNGTDPSASAQRAARQQPAAQQTNASPWAPLNR